MNRRRFLSLAVSAAICRLVPSVAKPEPVPFLTGPPLDPGGDVLGQTSARMALVRDMVRHGVGASVQEAGEHWSRVSITKMLKAQHEA